MGAVTAAVRRRRAVPVTRSAAELLARGQLFVSIDLANSHVGRGYCWLDLDWVSASIRVAHHASAGLAELEIAREVRLKPPEQRLVRTRAWDGTLPPNRHVWLVAAEREHPNYAYWFDKRAQALEHIEWRRRQDGERADTFVGPTCYVLAPAQTPWGNR